MTSALRWVSLLCLLAVGCGSDRDAEGPGAFTLPDDGLPASCHPFRSPGACAVPFPSSHFLVDDPETPTGKRVALASEQIAAGADITGDKQNDPFDPARWNAFDGFSVATPIVAWFPEKLDVGSLPSVENFDESLEASSATLVIDMETNELQAHFAELDVSADIEPSDRQALLLRLARHLRPDRRYGVAITRSLRTLDGATPSRPPGFESALRGKKSEDAEVQRAVAALGDVLASFATVGVREDDLLLAWDLHTASLAATTENVLTMRDAAMEQLGPEGTGYTLDIVEKDGWAEVHKWVRGTFEVPSFLSHDDGSRPDVELVLGPDGRPVIQRVANYVFELIIPKNATTTKKPMPLLVYGHGLLGTPLDGVSGTLRRFCNDRGWVCIGSQFIGLSEAEQGSIDPHTGQAGNAAALDAIKNVNALWWVADRMQQAHINTMAMTRTAKRILADAATFVEPEDGTPPFSALDASVPPVYYGISQGGIFGAPLLAYSQDLNRGVLHVGGSGFSVFVQRSVNWNQFFPGIRNGYPDRLDQQIVIALWQPAFDLAEGAGTAWAQGVHDRLRGTDPKELLFTFAVGDSQVPNVGSDSQIRTLDLPLLAPSAVEVWGARTTSGGDSNVAVYFDMKRELPPSTNATPLTDNDVHGDVRSIPAHVEMTDTFLRTGKVSNTCGGACSFPDG